MESIKRHTISITLAAIGFLLGIFWSNFSSLIQPLLTKLWALFAQLESYFQSHPIESGLIFAVVGAFVLPLIKGSRKIFVRLTRSPTVIDLLFQNEDHVHTVISHMRQTSFNRIGGGQEVVLPANSLFLPSSVSMSIAMLSSYCQKHYGDRKSAKFHYDHENWGARDHNFLCVGGPFVNEIVKSILNSNKIPDFRIDDVPTALDENDRFQAERENVPSNGAPLVKDYGFVIYMQSPWNPLKKVCVLFGLWPQGTLAAVEAILEHENKSTLASRFHYAVQKGDNVLGVVQVTVTGLLEGRGEFVKVRTF